MTLLAESNLSTISILTAAAMPYISNILLFNHHSKLVLGNCPLSCIHRKITQGRLYFINSILG